ncbi:hypothetical protein C8J57DRAFT_1244009 [Mycena rebaudengoi]|nr:hypothetical protein C8J57DRAFT_1244009 [Mycena rebaudengoi]
MCPHPDPSRATSLTNLSNAIQARFNERGGAADIDETIDLVREAVSLVSWEDPRRCMFLNNLAKAIHTWFDKRASPGDLDEASQLYREAFVLPPFPNPDSGMYLNNLAVAVAERFGQQGRAEDLDEGIQLHRQTVALWPSPHPAHPKCLVKLYKRVEDVNEAIQLHREVLVLSPSPQPARSAALTNLAITIWARAWDKEEGDRETGNIDKVIQLHHEALMLRPLGVLDKFVTSLDREAPHVDIAAVSRTLGQDVYTEAALRRWCSSNEAPANSPSPTKTGIIRGVGAVRFTGLRRVVSTLLVDTKTPKVLDKKPVVFARTATPMPEAPRSLRSSISEVVPHTPVEPAALQTLFMHVAHASRRAIRSVYLEELSSDELAPLKLGCDELSLSNEVTKLAEARPLGHPEHDSSLQNLASTLHTRFRQHGAAEDLDEALQFSSEVLKFRPFPHPLRGESLYNQSFCLASAHKHRGEAKFLDEAISAAGEASRDVISSPFNRFKYAIRWTQIAAPNNHQSSLEAHRTAIGLLPRLATLDLDIRSRQWSLIRQSTNLGSEAALCAIGLDQPRGAVELLEAGRSIFWSQALSLRTSLDNLIATQSNLASEFSSLSSKLEQTANGLGGRRTGVPPLERRIQNTVQRIRQLSGFEDFMQPKSMERLKQAAIDGPVVIVNARSSRCHALIVKSSGQVECVPLADNLTREFATILARAVQMLCDGAVSPFPFSIQNSERRKSETPPRLWWCLTGPFAFLPIHASGIYGTDVNISIADYVVSSYTPTLTVLDSASLPPLTDRMQVTGQSSLPFTNEELEKIRERVPKQSLTEFGTTESPATVHNVLSELQSSSILRFACHGTQDPSDPLESALLIGGERMIPKRRSHNVDNL